MAAAVKALKYRHARAVGAELIQYLEPPLARIDAPNILLVPIPLHASRQRKRGHNQAAVLAELLSKRAGVPWRNAVRRTRATRTQTELHRHERFANVAGAFEWHGPPPHGQSIVLIDDVVTTGATFEAAATACRAAGAPGVWGLAVAYRERG